MSPASLLRQLAALCDLPSFVRDPGARARGEIVRRVSRQATWQRRDPVAAAIQQPFDQPIEAGPGLVWADRRFTIYFD